MSLSRDAIICIIPHLDANDLINVGVTCWDMRIKVLDNQHIWYNWVIIHWDTNYLPAYHGLNVEDANWKVLALMHPMMRERELCKIHIRKRFEAPMSMKSCLRFFCEIKTNDGRVATIILTGNEIDYETFKKNYPRANLKNDGSLWFEYLPKESSVLVWLGEGGIHSEYNFYAVDRLEVQPKVQMSNTWVSPHYVERNYSLLSKKNYRDIGQLLHNDPQYYEARATTDFLSSKSQYNWSTGHSYHRSGNAPTGFASSTNNVEMPYVAAKSITKITTIFDPVVLYRQFVLLERPTKPE